MDPRLPASREDLYSLQMEVKQVQYAQNNHAERLLRLEKRQTDDSALKSVWNSPFPGVIGGTPQQEPAQVPHNELFDDFDEQGEQLLGSLHLGPTEEEPVRRGAASRANSVRFDESALHGSSWGGQSNRHSGDFGPTRPGSGLMMERTLSHKSDGRHSSAGHSVHSHHSVASGRASSIGIGDEDDSSFDVPAPPASLYVLGTVPSIVRCWLTTNFAHSTLLYADICTGSQRSTIDYTLLKDLDLLDEVQRDADGVYRVWLNVYLAEAVVTRQNNRSAQPGVVVPSMSVLFEVNRSEQTAQTGNKKSVRIFIGSDGLRAHSADVLFSQNTMVLYGSDRERLRVPFVRPEDESAFRHICTVGMAPEKSKLNANAAPFVIGDAQQDIGEEVVVNSSNLVQDDQPHAPISPMVLPATIDQQQDTNVTPEQSGKLEPPSKSEPASEVETKDNTIISDTTHREPSTGIWGSWRQGASNGADGPAREPGSASGYQPAQRGSRNMKVLKSSKSGSRTGSYEPPLPSRSVSESRRRSLNSGVMEPSSNGVNRWDVKRIISSTSSTSETKPPPTGRDNKVSGTLPRSVNPVGVGSAFSWMTPSSKSNRRPSSGGGADAD